MNERRTTSMLQRVPVILAVTAGSYGLPLQAHPAVRGTASNGQISRPTVAAAYAARQRRLATQC